LSGPKTRVDTAGSNHLDAFRLDGRVALITGADVKEDGIRAATRRLQATGGEAVPLRMDVTDPESVSTAVVVNNSRARATPRALRTRGTPSTASRPY
jgi:hypothetical protein